MTKDEMVRWHHQLNMEAWHAVVHGVVRSRTGLID